MAHGGGKTVTKSFVVKALLAVTETTVVAGNTTGVRVEGFYAYGTIAIRIYDVNSTTYHTMGSILTNSKGKGIGTVTVPRSTLAGKQPELAQTLHVAVGKAGHKRGVCLVRLIGKGQLEGQHFDVHPQPRLRSCVSWSRSWQVGSGPATGAPS